ncbi:MAG TPA: DUF4124 domain-containing protein [Gammaproteobacteria bacterium]|nr:DUF4124 domain-containing protein [Gammaproteobacteria bacterium]
MLINKIPYFLLLCVIGVAEGATYKWKDQNGQTVYGASPPPGVQAERIHTAPPSSSSDEEIKAFQQRQQQELESAKKAEFEANIAKEKEQEQKIWQVNCNAAKNKLLSLKEKPRVRQPDSSGQLAVIPEEEVALKIKQAETEVQVYCNRSKESSMKPSNTQDQPQKLEQIPTSDTTDINENNTNATGTTSPTGAPLETTTGPQPRVNTSPTSLEVDPNDTVPETPTP